MSEGCNLNECCRGEEVTIRNNRKILNGLRFLWDVHAEISMVDPNIHFTSGES